MDTGSQKWKAHENEQLITVESHSLSFYRTVPAVPYLRCLRPLAIVDFLACFLLLILYYCGIPPFEAFTARLI